MSEQKEEIHSKGDIKAYIIQDEDAMNPFEDWDTLGTLVIWHRNYSFGGEDGEKEYGDPKDFETMAKKEKLTYLPLYLFDHSGLTISTKPFSCPWDSGQVGYIYVMQKNWDAEYKDVKGTKEELVEKAHKTLRCEVDALDQYLTGDVWGVVVERETKCDKCGDESEDHLDSCWGFFGYEYAKEECKRMFDSAVELDEEIEEAAEEATKKESEHIDNLAEEEATT